MKKLSVVIAFLIIMSSYSYAAHIVYDVRTTGNDANGGCFDTSNTGTDYSTQDSPQFSYTDLVIGADNTTVTSSAHPFDIHSPGNCINITGGSGFTVQRAYIISQTGGAAKIATGTWGTALSTGGTGNLGGAIATIPTLANLVTNTLPGTVNEAWIKSGTYTITSTAAFNTGSILIGGYGTTHGDGGTAPLITTATNSTILISIGANSTYIWKNLSLSNTASVRSSGIYSNAVPFTTIDGVTFDGFSKAINGVDGNYMRMVVVRNSEIKNSTVYAIHVGNNISIINSYIHDNTASGTVGIIGQEGGAFATTILGTLIVSNTGKGFVQSGNIGLLTIRNSTIANNSSDNLDFENGNMNVDIENSIIYGSTAGYGINSLAGGAQPGWNLYNNAFGANSLGDLHAVTTTAGTITNVGSITLTASPFVSSTNLALNNTAGGGASCKAAGIPGVFPGGLTTGYPDVGAVQSQGSSGASGPYGYVQ